VGSYRWSPIPPISTKGTTTSHLKPLNNEKKTTYHFGNTYRCWLGTGTTMWRN